MPPKESVVSPFLDLQTSRRYLLEIEYPHPVISIFEATLRIASAGVAAGVASDGIGRRIIYSAGLAVCALAVAGSPSSTTFTQLLLWRCLFSVGEK